MAPRNQFLELIERIYASAEDGALWPATVEQCAEFTGASVGLLFAYKPHTQFELAVLHGLDQSILKPYAAHYATLDDQLQKIIRHPPGTILAGPELNGGSRFYESEFYVDFYGSQLRIKYCMGGMLFRTPGFTAGIGLHRGADRDEFDKSEIRRLKMLLPHLQQALRLHFEVAGLRQANLSQMELLDRVPIGLIFLSSGSRIVEMNSLGRGMINARDGVACEHGCLVASTAEETGRLQRLVADASNTSLGRGTSAGGTITLTRPSAKASLAVAVMPIGVGTAAPSARATALAICVDPEHKPLLPAAILKHLYGLTPAEAGVAVGLANGDSLKELSEHKGISYETLRQHLKRIFQKTGTARQADLVRLLLTGPATLLR